MNIVEQTKQKIEIEANKAKLKAYFTQTNYGNFACKSRVYLAPIDQPAYNCKSKSVIKCWEFNQAQHKGCTEHCERFKIYKDVLNHLLELNK